MANAVKDKKTPNSNEVKVSRSNRRRVEPTKRTLNLLYKEKTHIDPLKWIPGVLIVLILAGLFGKFAVADRYAALDARETAFAAMKQELEDTRAAYADFNEVREQYNMYSYSGFDRTIADRLDVLTVLENRVFPVCDVQNLAISGKTVSMSLTNLDLSQVSRLIASLKAEPLVKSVYVSTANHDTQTFVGTATVTVELNDATELEGGEAE